MTRKKSAFPREVFLSHASQDRQFVKWLRDQLRQHGIRVWHSDTHIVGAQKWHDAIGKALKRCDWFLVVLSPASVRSIWVQRELFFALEQSRYNNRIVPAVYRACNVKKLSWTLSSMQSVAFTKSRVDGLAELLRIWGIR